MNNKIQKHTSTKPRIKQSKVSRKYDTLLHSRQGIHNRVDTQAILGGYRQLTQQGYISDVYDKNKQITYRITGTDHMGRNVEVDGDKSLHFLLNDEKYLILEFPMNTNNGNMNEGTFLVWYTSADNQTLVTQQTIKYYTDSKGKKLRNVKIATIARFKSHDLLRSNEDNIYYTKNVQSLVYDHNNTRYKYGVQNGTPDPTRSSSSQKRITKR